MTDGKAFGGMHKLPLGVPPNLGVQGDMSKLADIDRLYDAVQQQGGQIDVLFANAGGGEFAPQSSPAS